MAIAKKTNYLKNTVEGKEIEAILRKMKDDIGYTTTSSYSSNSEMYADNTMTFVEKHMHYLNTHPNVNPDQYISNLRIMTKVRV